MKRLGVLLLLVSLGLNVGLGLKLRQHAPARWTVPGDAASTGRKGARLRPAPEDSAAWRMMLRDRVERMTDRLNLSSEQAAVFQELQRAGGIRLRERRVSMIQNRQMLQDLTSGNDFDPASLRSSMMQMRRDQAELDSLATELLLQELSVLDPEQRAVYLELLPLERGPFGGGGRGAGHGGRSGRGSRRGQ